MQRIFLLIAAIVLAMGTWADVIFLHQPDTVNHQWHIYATCEGDTIYTFSVPRTLLTVGDTIEAHISDIAPNTCATWRTFLYYDGRELTSTTEGRTWTGVVTQAGEHEMGWGIIVYHTTGKVSDKCIFKERIRVAPRRSAKF